MSKINKDELKNRIRAEYKKCATDPVHFMKKYCKIQHPKLGTIPFELFSFQEKCIREFNNNPKNIILKCRQMGISTLTAGYSLWLMTFHKDKSVLVIATKQDVAKNMVTKVRFMNDNLPSWIKVEAEENNRTSLRLKNGSQIKAVSASSDAGRSEALSLLIVDEAAFISEIEDIWTSVQSAMTHGGGRAIVLSTPNGMGNWFYRMWKDSEEGIQKFNTIKLHWTLHPNYDQKWRNEQDVLLGSREASQECDCSFISSGNSVVELEILEWFRETHVKDPISKEYHDSNYWRWGYPNYIKDYVIAADVARGDGEDYSAFHVIDIEKMEQVAEYKGKIETEEFGNLLTQVATEWNNALLLVENGTVGWAVIQQIINRNYQNLFYMTEDLKYVDPENQWTNKWNAKEKRAIAGFTMSVRTRPLIISKLDLFFREKSIIIHSSRTINELMTFIWENGKAQAAKGYNDDLTMSLGMALWVYDTALMLRNKGMDLQRKALGGIGKTGDDAVFKTSHLSRYPQVPSKDPFSMQIRGISEDLRWLLK